jgi:hypothetical protein
MIMTRRPGLSLTEVLVSLFILTLGVIGILTMFPLGAAQMAYAVRDDRSSQAAVSADGYMRWYWQNYVCNSTNPSALFDANFQPAGSTQAPSILGGLFDNPKQLGGPFASLPSLATVNTAANQVNYTAGLMSYPVIVDPMGNLVRPGLFGDAPNYASIPRCSLVGITGTGQLNPNLYAYRACSLMDSLGYNPNGAPTSDLEMRYNWLWVLQRPQFVNQVYTTGVNGVVNGTNVLNSSSYTSANMNLYTANMTVVVFDRRPYLYPPPSVAGFEVVMPASFTSGSTTVVVPASSAQQALGLKPGMWVMDATINPTGVAPVSLPIRQANFYRIVSITQVGAQVNIELQSPVSAPTGYSALGFNYTGTLIALNGVSGVFVRPPLTWN